jgi:hypothetical protein
MFFLISWIIELCGSCWSLTHDSIGTHPFQAWYPQNDLTTIQISRISTPGNTYIRDPHASFMTLIVMHLT